MRTRLADLDTVLGQTQKHKLTLLKSAATTLRRNYIKIRKMKSVYFILNQFSLREGQRVLIGRVYFCCSYYPHSLSIIGEGWLPTNDISSVKGALQVSGEHSGSPIVPTMERIPTTEQHPTYHRTNKYTAGYQVGGN